jgi:alpha(1,3/1,4) fucosyltransferase
MTAMKKACLFANSFYVGDAAFGEGDVPLNRDDMLKPFRDLRDALKAKGYLLRTQDFHSPEESELTLYMDMPTRLPRGHRADRSYLLLMESQLIIPYSYNPRKHVPFKKIFTWHKDFLNDAKYIKIQIPQVPPELPPDVPFRERKKLCCLIGGGKLSLHPKELYSERIRWIRWFEKNHPDDFDFYGAGWNRLWMTGPLWIRSINKLPFWRKLLYPPFPSYKGRVDKKLEVLSQYKFSICFENARDIEGYITEKIFDCFFAGNIPIYRGPQSITDSVPADCFIDLRKFKSKEEVYDFMKNMSEAEFEGYRSRIRAYLKSEQFKQFSIPVFVETVVQGCLT